MHERAGDGGGFSGVGNGASTRAASERGSTSRADMGSVLMQASPAAADIAAVMVVASVAAAVVVASVAAAAVVAEQSCPPLSAEKNTMNFKNMMQALAVALLLATSPVINAAPPVPAMQKLAQQSFAKPEDAARALAEAVRAEDVNALLAVLGPASRSWLASGDAVADRQDWAKFLAAYDRKNSISLVSDGRAVVLGWRRQLALPGASGAPEVIAGFSMQRPDAKKSSTDVSVGTN
jgi:hypothetical protein